MKRLFYTVLFTLAATGLYAQKGDDAARLAQQQLDAYNNRDIDAFLAPYSDSVKIYNHPNDLQFTGKAQMRRRYAGMFQNTPDLHCTLINRMVLGNVVIDQESVIISKDREPIRVIAMYKIAAGKIAEVYFIRPE
jgi:hypothetical protein